MAAVPGIDPAWRWKKQQPSVVRVEPLENVEYVNNHFSLAESDKVINRAKQAKWRAAHPELNRQRARDGMRKRRASKKDNG